MSTSLSVAMCTYNGARFIEEQLRSIMAQTMPVDEVIVCDDGSTDGTVERVRAMGIDNIKTYCNQQKLGTTLNFQKAISLCQGDIIFLADQDDRWLPDKVATMVACFDRHPKTDVLFSNANLIGENGNRLPARGGY